jgi:hypothetical protein
VRLSLSRISRRFLLVGFFVPFILEALFYVEIVPADRLPEWLLIALWPAFGFVMASDTGGGPDSGRAILGFVMSVLANALVYLLVGALVSFFYRRFFQPRTRTGG